MRKTDFFMKAGDPKALTVEQLMQDAVVRCTSRTDASTIAHMMTHRNFGSLPVVEEDGTLIGIVTEYDLLQAMLDGRDLRKILATEIMSTHPVTVTEDQTLAQVADLFQDRYLTRVPVVRNNQLVGILARRDLLYGYMKASQYWS
ncbi:cyclic nucleotide-binding/CBS domain-containing protein [Nitrospira sp. BLG_2]|uniref:CBS domain-containing protein n=1 Tax=Nitrospira sp. BLG_2 TaxID=3397507 RepID=UPI003B99FF2F